jgi:hypothetical protein
MRLSSVATLLALIACGGLTARAAEAQVKQIKLEVHTNEADVVSVATLQQSFPDFDGKTFVLTTSDAETAEADAKATKFRPVPSQADDLDGDGKPDEIAFLVDAKKTAPCIVTLSYGPEAAIAPLRVDTPKRAHAMYAQKYEGMGWESDKVAWRLYFDKRNAIDLYGKKKQGLALDYFAKPGVNYHAESPIGRDIFKNGDTLGLGSIGAFVDGKVVKVSDVDSRTWKVLADGPVRAIAELYYKGWKVGGKSVDLTSRLTIWAGQHWFEHQVTVKNAEGIQFVTGLPKKPDVNISLATTRRDGKGKSVLSTWGKQVLKTGATAVEALPDENLGLAIVLPAVVKSPTVPPNDSDMLLALPMDSSGTTRYLVAAAWDKEASDDQPPFGANASDALRLPAAAKLEQAWKDYLNSLPVTVPTVKILTELKK